MTETDKREIHKEISPPVEKRMLSDNYDKPVFYWQKFAPKGYNADADKFDKVRHEDLEQRYYFHREKDQRVLIFEIYKEAFLVECFYADPFPNGYYYHIDWNDSTFLELLPLKEHASILRIVSIIVSKGYKYYSHKIYNNFN